MSRELRIVWLGRPRHDPWEELCADYRARIERDMPVVDRPLRPSTRGDPARRLAAEAAAIRAALPDPCRLVALDRQGRGLSSLALAERLGRWLADSPHPLVFAVGSDLGLAAELLEGAAFRLSLGPLTLPHPLARLILYEQLYRALSLRAGIKYHRQPL